MSNRQYLATQAYINLLHCKYYLNQPVDPELEARLLKEMEPDHPCTPSQLPSARCKEPER